ncbi:ABC transporter ATP-binding protein [Romboutsia ilealis]|uniref:ABC transporter ATP-binding protein n=1 Tax=Romboutsia faecis TaxID=2764597 RepID=A0ABR7JQB5_9FIRM|nr:ABC transporter ATP-binding protein [Romboutsia faecis]MBC5997104.1 ABC transporter ATP-binding protein [Romboutsia faecis]MRN23386.1 ABC transporter ATP-binding protein [Romboutsia ilealis]
MNTILEFKNITYSYNNNSVILDKVNATFKQGKFYTIIGPSGSGKTTFLSLAAGLDKANSGSILFDNRNINSIGLSNYRNKYISIIFQSYNLLTYMSALDNIICAMEIKDTKCPNKKEKAIEILKQVGLTEEQGKQKVLTLSGGQQQRVAIARALATESNLILADEATGNLDENTSNEIISIFEKLVKEHNKTVILVTHNNEIAKKSDITYLVKNKQLLQTQVC